MSDDLSLVTTQDLIEELEKRFSAIEFLGYKDHDDDQGFFAPYSNGNSYLRLSMLDVAYESLRQTLVNVPDDGNIEDV